MERSAEKQLDSVIGRKTLVSVVMLLLHSFCIIVVVLSCCCYIRCVYMDKNV